MTEKKIQKRGAKTPVSVPNYNRGPLSWLLIGLLVMLMISTLMRMQQVQELAYSPDFLDHVRAGHVKSVVIHEGKGKILGEFYPEAVSEGKPVRFEVSISEMLKDETLLPLLKSNRVEMKVQKPDIWTPLLGNLLLFVLLIGLIYFFFIRNIRTGGGMLMNFARSKHRVQSKSTGRTFEDVAGIEEAKEEVAEIIEFLKNPKKFQKIGGRIPRGVLLVGPPGCGKTLLAKAIAGEADVPFFSIAGSDFVEMFVGVGASRVRDLFRQAKENSPCIIFLDEIDAIGRRRGAGLISGGHDEREQTLNAILVEMDGFDTNDQVIVIAATNRADILDPALTRPGRFDRRVVVPLPDLKGRMKILQIHARRIKCGPDVDFERLARGTPMFSGAELEALINEAAISASMQNKEYVEMSDLEEARDKVRWGRAKRSRVVDEYDRRLTAYHEAGHALVQSLLPDADPLHKVSIIPRGPMGGATFALPEKDRLYYSKRYCDAQLQIFFAGRIAVKMVFNDVDSGAYSDIRQATILARQMITEWGMGEKVGPVYYGADGMDTYFYAPKITEYSQKTAELIDQEVKNLLDAAHAKVEQLLMQHRDKLEALAETLLKYETLDAEEVKIIISGRKLEKPTVSELLALEQKKSSKAQSEKDSFSPEKEGQKDASSDFDGF
ncbi:MAG TPA: ATP-dependent zinc metalloprotease FtsH [Anaerohalosphaeraceae bacterium]|nr:ATP-dependent zinc metalloprotease FtsH [Anaerohalosphaeraceae bacterium]HQG05987.1 ATP-dependent zinc metalloprotease FtsH [Anaerohalosphaeraceae bacterium]HQI07269.1 ATP-dependent zinc metalloprotease FtsH [Anaerohalosphaeraceae bacterium]HQJ67286.1 ATP-dependent zinc metalloprotease FtsH [Anaerohalosphaeraceae bacterium]